MGYFSNGTEGMQYEDDVCAHCKHAATETETMQCAVMMAHSLWNYDAVGKDADPDKAAVLNAMISQAGIFNAVCSFFHATSPSDEAAVIGYGCRVQEASARHERDAAEDESVKDEKA